MRYLLDTDVVSNLEKLHPNANLIGWLHDVDSADLAIPLSVVFEIQYGVELARHDHPERAAQKEAWLRRVLQARDLCILRPSVADACLRARMAATPALRNFLLQSPNARKIKTGEDLAIAATAIVHQAAIVTFNEVDFRIIHEHFPLPGVFHPGRLQWVIEPRSHGDRFGVGTSSDRGTRVCVTFQGKEWAPSHPGKRCRRTKESISRHQRPLEPSRAERRKRGHS